MKKCGKVDLKVNFEDRSEKSSKNMFFCNFCWKKFKFLQLKAAYIENTLYLLVKYRRKKRRTTVDAFFRLTSRFDCCIALDFFALDLSQMSQFLTGLTNLLS